MLGSSVVQRAVPARPRLVARGKGLQVNAFFSKFLDQQASRKFSVGKKEELIEQLLLLTEDTDAGFKISEAGRRAVSDLVEELQAYCMKDPLSSESIFGRWEVRYASKPQTAGGPFKSPTGRVVFPGQQAIQVIEEPNVCINEINFKTLGFIPGSVSQQGTIEPVDGRTFEITFTTNTGKKLGGPPKRMIEILYLDENIRIARALPVEENQETGFYVFTREGMEFESTQTNELRTQTGPSKAAIARAEREKLVEMRQEAKEMYTVLNTEAKELALDAQASAKELTMLEKSAAKVLKEAAAAIKLIEKAEDIATNVQNRLVESQKQEVALEKELLALQREFNSVKQQIAQGKKDLGPRRK
jgi:hypothetical protein